MGSSCGNFLAKLADLNYFLPTAYLPPLSPVQSAWTLTKSRPDPSILLWFMLVSRPTIAFDPPLLITTNVSTVEAVTGCSVTAASAGDMGNIPTWKHSFSPFILGPVFPRVLCQVNDKNYQYTLSMYSA